MKPTLLQRAVSEAVGTALLLATVIGSGIMGERLCGGNVAVALLANTIATGAGLVALILTFGPISGAHFNPAVTLADASQGGLSWRDVPVYLAAQGIGAFAGAATAHVMFSEPLFSASNHVRSGPAQLVSEFVATFGLLAVIWGCVRRRPSVTPFAVGAYITAAYWFTSSSSFANPAVTLARAASNTFAGIRPVDAPGFIVAQLLGAAAATWLFWWLVPSVAVTATDETSSAMPGHSTDGAGGKERDGGKRLVTSMASKVASVLFACIHNAGRSQMAAAWFNLLADPEKAKAISAGTAPGSRVHPEVVAAMNEVGVDLSAGTPQFLSDDLAKQASLLVTMGCGEACPHIPGLARDDWPLEDPKGKPVERVREIRDDIRNRVVTLLRAQGWEKPTP